MVPYILQGDRATRVRGVVSKKVKSAQMRRTKSVDNNKVNVRTVLDSTETDHEKVIPKISAESDEKKLKK
jgi:hypothetical protein